MRAGMSWPVSLLLGVFAACAGAVMAGYTGEYVGRVQHLTTFQGARAYFVVLFCIPFGLLLGFVAGVWRGRCSAAASVPGFLLELGVSVASVAAVLLALAGAAKLMADPSPVLRGRLMARFEITLPEGEALYDEESRHRVVASLAAGATDRQRVATEIDGARHSGAIWTVPALVELRTESAQRALLVALGPEPEQVFELGLPARPVDGDREWSEWRRAKRRADGSAVEPERACAVRYRVYPVE